MSLGQPKYAAAQTDITITLASLATDSNLLAGRASTVLDNTNNRYWNGHLQGKIRCGTSPTTGGVIEIWAYGEYTTDTYADSITGTDANKTITSANVKYSGLLPVWSTTVDNTTDRDYFIPPISIASVFRGVLPRKFGFFVVHSTGVNLNSTGSNHELHIRFNNPESVSS